MSKAATRVSFVKTTAVVLLALGILEGCGAMASMDARTAAPASPPPPQPQSSAGYAQPAKSAEDQRTYASVAEAQDALARAGKDFDAVVVARAKAPSADKPPTAGQSTPTAPPPSTPKNDASPTQQTDAQSASSPCATACKALASMQRATDSICRMTSESDERCVAARKKVADSTAKLGSCGC
jgi:hypothetical protein